MLFSHITPVLARSSLYRFDKFVKTILLEFNQGAVNLPQVDILKGLTNLSKAFSLIVIERFCKNSSMRNLSLPPFLVEPIFCFKIGCPKFNLTDFSNKRIYYIPHTAFNSFTCCIILASPVLPLSG